LLRKNP